MIDDPIVLILCEAAARGRHLRLAREHAPKNKPQSDDNPAEGRRADQVVGVAMTPQHGADAIEKEFDMCQNASDQIAHATSAAGDGTRGDSTAAQRSCSY